MFRQEDRENLTWHQTTDPRLKCQRMTEHFELVESSVGNLKRGVFRCRLRCRVDFFNETRRRAAFNCLSIVDRCRVIRDDDDAEEPLEDDDKRVCIKKRCVCRILR